MRVFGKSAVLSATALVALLAFGATTSHAVTNVCASGKKKCVQKKTAAILKCYVAAEKDATKQGTVFTACVNKAKAKFDGGTKGFDGSCFGKLENKYDFCVGGANDGEHCEAASACPGGSCTQGCLTDSDLAALENKVDAYVLDVETELNPGDVPPPNVVNLCASGKKKCVLKKGDALLKCHVGCEKDPAKCGGVLTACIDKAEGKFDGGTKGFDGSCFGKLENKYNFCTGGANDGEHCNVASECPGGGCTVGCLTAGDLAALEDKVDDFVDDVVCELDSSTCSGPCGNGMIDAGEDCDPPSSQCPNAAPGIMCSATCQCPCPNTIEFTGTSTDGVLDAGWTGLGHDATVISDGTTTVDVTSCAGSSRPCGVCNFTGPIDNAGAANYNTLTGTKFNDHRCTGNVRVTCGTGGEQPACAGAGGTCEHYFGTLLPLVAGGVATCVENRFNLSFTGTANIETGDSKSSPKLTSRVFGGATNPHPCPRCLGDATPNDGKRQGTCSGGTDNASTCDGNGSSPNAHFGTTSLDCRPSTSVLASLPIDLTNTTGTATKTLSGTSPNCRATGFTALKCFCDTCASLAAEPCTSDADCTGGRTCGGLRCTGGVNLGGLCTVAGANSQCPGSSCGRPGQATASNSCADATCTATTGNSGECGAGPADNYCSPNATMIPCIGQSDCDVEGLRSCNGGVNVNKVCTADGQCPGGTDCSVANANDTGHPGGCCIDLCNVTITRPCYTDNGISGASINASGNPDAPVNDASDPTLAALFCIGPVASATVNLASGLPGLGRLELLGHAQGLP